MKTEQITNGHTEGPSRKKMLMLAIYALALFALVLTVCTCIATDDSSATKYFDGESYEMDMTTDGGLMMITATNTTYIGKVSLSDVPSDLLPWKKQSLYSQITEIQIIGFSGGNVNLFRDYTNLTRMSGEVFWTDTGTSVLPGTKVGTWVYDFEDSELTVSALLSYNNYSMPNYVDDRNKLIPWANVPVLASTEVVIIEGFSNCGWQAFKDINVDDPARTKLDIRGDIRTTTQGKIGHWEFTMTDGVLLIVYDGSTDTLGTMPTWTVDFEYGTDTRPWSHGITNGEFTDWNWYAHVSTVKNRGFSEYSIDAYKGITNALIASVGNIYENPDDSGALTGEWYYIIRAPSGYKFGITTGNMMIESTVKLDTWGQQHQSMPDWGKFGQPYSPWYRLGYSWLLDVETVYILNYNGYSELAFYGMNDLNIYTVGYVDTTDHMTYVGEWSYDHQARLLYTKAYVADSVMPTWSSIYSNDQRPWGRYDNWKAEVKTIKVSMFKEISNNAFLGFTPEAIITVGEVLSSTGVKNGEWLYNDHELTLTLEGYVGAVMKNYNATSAKAPWTGMDISIIKTFIITGYTNIGTYTFYGCSSLETIIANDVVSVSKSDTFYDIDDTVKNITMNSLASLPNSMFSGSYKKLETFSSSSLVQFPTDAFRYCSALTTINCESITTVGQRAFSECTSLTSVTTAPEVTILGYAFEKCSSLTSYNTEEGHENQIYLPLVRSIGTYAFSASGVKDVFVGYIKNVGSADQCWNEYAFADCKSLERFVSDSILRGSSFIFKGCDNLKYLELSELTTTEGFAFKGHKSLETLKLQHVQYITKEMFMDCKALKTVVLPDIDATKNCYLYHSCFRNCESLTTINFDSCTFYDDYAFADCTSLTVESVNTISSKVGAIQDYSFANCTGLVGDLVLRHSGSIYSHAFRECTGLTSVDISSTKSSGTYMSENAFYLCENIVTVKLPIEYSYINSSAFSGCTSLKYVLVPGTEIDAENILAKQKYDEDVAAGLIDPNDRTKDPVIKNTLPTACTTLYSNVFFKTAIENMYFPTNTTTIGSASFRECKALTTVDLNCVQYVNREAFCYCDKLANVSFGLPLETLGDYAFAGTNLTSITMNCASLGSYAFDHCGKLSYVNISKTTTVNSYCFNECSELTTVVSGQLDKIYNNAFYNCQKLTYVDLTTVTSVSGSAFYNCQKLSFIPSGSTIPDELKLLQTVGGSAFQYCYKIESLTAPNCKTIGSYAFANTPITKVVLMSVETIESHGFNSCTKLTDVNLNQVTLIKTRAFSSCSTLERLVLSHDNMQKGLTISDNVFNGCTNLVGESFERNEKGEPINIVPTYFGNVVGLGSSAFYNCYRITEFTGDRVASVGTHVFYYCRELRSVSMAMAPNIGNNCFEGCIKLQTANLSMTETLPYACFYNCSALRYVTASNATSVGNSAFSGCTNLKTIGTIENVADLTYVKTIGDSSFYNSGIENYKFGSKLESIANSAFRYSQAESYVFPNSLKTIGTHIMGGSNVREVVFPSSVTSMGYYQFYDCSFQDGSKTIDIYFNGQPEKMGINRSYALFYFTPGISMRVNIYYPEGTDTSKITTTGSNYKRYDNLVPMATYMIVTSKSSMEESTTPDYGTVTAIDGSQIVLPYCTDQSGFYEKQYFSVQASTLAILSLGLPKAGEESVELDYAMGGDRIHTYLQSSTESLVLMGNLDNSGFARKITITSTSDLLPEGVHLEPESAEYSYGSQVKIPVLDDSRYTISRAECVYSVQGSATVKYTLPITKGYFKLGCYLTAVNVSIESHTVDTHFIDGEKEWTQSFIFGNKYGTLPPGDPAAGYKFDGWYTQKEGGEQITEDHIVQRELTLYARYVPIEYNVHLYTNKPEFSQDLTVQGVYTIYVSKDGSLYFTDVVHKEQTLLFDPTGVLPGYKIRNYWVDGTEQITTDKPKGPNEKSLEIAVSWDAVTYGIKLMFYDKAGQELDDVIIEGLLHGHENNVYNSGDIITGIKYSELINGYIISIPKHKSVTFNKAFAAYDKGKTTEYKEIIQDPTRNCQMVLSLDYYIDNIETLEIQFNFLSGYYRTQFVYNDDNNKVLDSTTLISDETAYITTPVTPYSKSGYTFKYWQIAEGKTYPADSKVEVTDELKSYAQYGMLIFSAQWEYNMYTIHYDPGEYTEGFKENDTVKFGEPFKPTVITGYLGHSLVSWVWVKEDGTEESSPIKADTDIILTKEIVDTYGYGEDDLDLKLLAKWDLREYDVSTSADAYPPFTVYKVKYTESFTLWDGTTARVPEEKSDSEFGAWTCNSQSYANMAVVVINDALALYGDNNKGEIVFDISWIQTEYMIKYNFCDGKDPTGKLPTGAVGPYKIGDAFEPANGNVLEKEGYTYDGWKLLETDFTAYQFTSGKFDAGIATYADSNKVVTLYANWAQIKYKITYDLEGGTRGEYAPNTATYGTEVLISNPTKSGYTFGGWTATNLSDQAIVKVGDNWQRWDGTYAITYTMYKNLCSVSLGTVAFKATWSTLEYEVKYQPNCDNYTLGEKTDRVKVGDKIMLPTITGNERVGYKWKGWGFDEYNTIETGITFTASMTSYAVNNVITIYGVWEPVKYTVSYTYYPEYGERTVNAEFGVAVKIPTIERIGYTFLGWTSTDIDTNTSYYSNDQMIWYKWDGVTVANASYFKDLTAAVTDGKVTLVGVWEQKLYKLVYTANATSAKDPIDENEYTIGSPVTLVKTIEGSNNGKTFLGWTLKQGSTDIVSFTEFTTTVASYADITNSVHLYGVWSEGTYTVTVDLQGCTPSAIPAGWTLTSTGVYTKQFDYNTKMDVVMDEWSKITLSKDGYVFSSWEYSNATVVADTLVTATFTEVSQTLLYVFIGIVVVCILGAFIFTRIER